MSDITHNRQTLSAAGAGQRVLAKLFPALALKLEAQHGGGGYTLALSNERSGGMTYATDPHSENGALGDLMIKIAVDLAEPPPATPAWSREELIAQQLPRLAAEVQQALNGARLGLTSAALKIVPQPAPHGGFTAEVKTGELPSKGVPSTFSGVGQGHSPLSATLQAAFELGRVLGATHDAPAPAPEEEVELVVRKRDGGEIVTSAKVKGSREALKTFRRAASLFVARAVRLGGSKVEAIKGVSL